MRTHNENIAWLEATYAGLDPMSRAGVRIRVYDYVSRHYPDMSAMEKAVTDELAGKPLPGYAS